MTFEKSWGRKHGLSAPPKELLGVIRQAGQRSSPGHLSPGLTARMRRLSLTWACSFCGIFGYSIQNSHS